MADKLARAGNWPTTINGWQFAQQIRVFLQTCIELEGRRWVAIGDVRGNRREIGDGSIKPDDLQQALPVLPEQWHSCAA